MVALSPELVVCGFRVLMKAACTWPMSMTFL